MKIKRILYVSIAILATTGIVLLGINNKNQSIICEEEIKDEGNPYLNQFISDYENFLIDSLKVGNTPGMAVCIIKDSSIIYINAFGVKELGTADSINIHTVFRLASVSKCFASFLTGICVEDSLLEWDDKVTEHVPKFRLKSAEQINDLCVSNVLSHTTSIPYHAFTNLIEYGANLDTMLNQLKDLDSIGPVGTVYSYQNVAYCLIEKVLQSVSGKEYKDLLRENVFEPLQMNDASVTFEGMDTCKNKAQPYLYYAGKWNKTRIQKTYYNAKAAGGVNASISDMANFLLALSGNRPEVISQKTLNEICTPFIETPIRYKYAYNWPEVDSLYYGMGMRVFYCGEDTVAYHGGYVLGYRTELAFNRSNNTGICILMNSPSGVASKSVPAFYRMYELYCDSIDSWERKSLKPEVGSREDF